MKDALQIDARVRDAIEAGEPVVALETTVIAHGLPWPDNIETARAMQAAISAEDGVPAFIGIVSGHIRVGLEASELEHFATATDVHKASRRDLSTLVALGRNGATTVAATMSCAAAAGIRLFATGGIGGVHRGAEASFDISADITELARTPIAVVCSGAKSILDIEKTLELLETAGVPVVGYGTDRFPAFYQRETPHCVPARVDSAEDAAKIVHANRALGNGGLVIANPIDTSAAIDGETLEGWLDHALVEARKEAVSGKRLTPYLLERLAVLSEGRTLSANKRLLEDNARTAARIAVALVELET